MTLICCAGRKDLNREWELLGGFVYSECLSWVLVWVCWQVQLSTYWMDMLLFLSDSAAEICGCFICKSGSRAIGQSAAATFMPSISVRWNTHKIIQLKFIFPAVVEIELIYEKFSLRLRLFLCVISGTLWSIQEYMMSMAQHLLLKFSVQSQSQSATKRLVNQRNFKWSAATVSEPESKSASSFPANHNMVIYLFTRKCRLQIRASKHSFAMMINFAGEKERWMTLTLWA